MNERLNFKCFGGSVGINENRDVDISRADIVAVRSVSDEHTMIYLTSGAAFTVVATRDQVLAAIDE